MDSEYPHIAFLTYAKHIVVLANPLKVTERSFPVLPCCPPFVAQIFSTPPQVPAPHALKFTLEEKQRGPSCCTPGLYSHASSFTLKYSARN